MFEQANLEASLKTTAAKACTCACPLADLSWDEAKDFTERIAPEWQAGSLPLRGDPIQGQAQGKTFIDYLRNGRGATFSAPYSTRARAAHPSRCRWLGTSYQRSCRQLFQHSHVQKR